MGRGECEGGAYTLEPEEGALPLHFSPRHVRDREEGREIERRGDRFPRSSRHWGVDRLGKSAVSWADRW